MTLAIDRLDRLPTVREVLAIYQSLPPAERRVADVVVSSAREAVGLTSSELARRASCSQPAVSRFCARLSTGSFAAFKLRLAQEIGIEPRAGRRMEGTLSRAVGDAGSVSPEILKTTEQDLSTALRAVDTLDPEALRLAAGTLATAGSVVTCGFNLSGSVAWRLANLLHRSGVRARPECDPHDAPWVSDLGSDDVLVVVSYRGSVPQLMDTIGRARERGTRVVALTNEAQSPLAQVADVLLLTRAPTARTDEEYVLGSALYVQLAAARALWMAVRAEKAGVAG